MLRAGLGLEDMGRGRAFVEGIDDGFALRLCLLRRDELDDSPLAALSLAVSCRRSWRIPDDGVLEYLRATPAQT